MGVVLISETFAVSLSCIFIVESGNEFIIISAQKPEMVMNFQGSPMTNNCL